MKAEVDEVPHESLKKPTIPIFIEVLETLGEQGFIDVEPTEREYDLTSIYDFLVTSQIADCTERKYWLHLVNEDACLMLANALKEISTQDREICADILEKLKETEQIYIVGHDVPISVSKALFNLLNERRKKEAEKRGIPEIQYEWEDFFWTFLGK